MPIIPWKKKTCDPFSDCLDWDHPFWGLSLFPLSEAEPFRSGRNVFPAVDVSEDEKNVYIKADLPGLKKEDITVSLEGKVLKIRGERKSGQEKKDKRLYRVERSFGVFERRIHLNTAVNEAGVSGHYRDGVLELSIPKAASETTKVIKLDG